MMEEISDHKKDIHPITKDGGYLDKQDLIGRDDARQGWNSW
jgi:hypothetical protein